jgi:phosphosulfolactate phosphohydrolase-like enzyme
MRRQLQHLDLSNSPLSFARAEGLKELFQKSANSAGTVKTNQIADLLINALNNKTKVNIKQEGAEQCTSV